MHAKEKASEHEARRGGGGEASQTVGPYPT